MRILSAHIDGFGVLAEQDVPALPAGLSIFLGLNEAGKSTCLDFFRAMLAGYPDPRSREAKERPLAPLHGGTGGGSLLLATDIAGTVHLTRRPGSGGGPLALTDASGKPLESAVGERLLGGVTRELYRNVYGFSLSELQTFDSLDAEGVRNALYGASFGLGVRPPGEALKTLDKKLEDLFKTGGSKPVINALLAELKDVRTRMRNHESDAATYERLATRLESLEIELAAVREQRVTAESQRHRIERRMAAWKLWTELVSVEGQLARLSPVVERFPDNGIARFDQLTELRQEREATLATAKARLNRHDEELAAQHFNIALADSAPQLESLAERKASFSNALSTLPSSKADLAHTEASLAGKLASLGPDWSLDRARSLDRSLFTREEMERHAEALRTAAADTERLSADRSRCMHERDDAARDEAVARATLSAFGSDMVTGMSAENMVSLSSRLDRAENALEELPAVRAALDAARQAHAEAATRLHPVGEASEETLASLPMKLLARREAILGAHRQAEAASRAHTESGYVLQQERERHGEAAEALALLDGRLVAQAFPTRGHVDAHASGLRRLMRDVQELRLARAALQSAEERLTAERSAAPQPRGNAALSATGFGVGLCALLPLLALVPQVAAHPAVTGLLASLGLSANAAGQNMFVALCAVIALAGVTLGLALRRRPAPDAAAHAERIGKLEEHRAQCHEEQAQLETSVSAMIAEGLAPGSDDAALEQAATQLERLREQCIEGTRLAAERMTASEQCRKLRDRLDRANERHTQAAAAHDAAVLRLDGLLKECGADMNGEISIVPSLLERAEAVRALATRVEGAAHAVQVLEQRMLALANLACELPFLAESCSAAFNAAGISAHVATLSPQLLAASPALLVECCRSTLLAMQQAERTRQERKRAEDALATAAARLGRTQEALAAAEAAVTAQEETTQTTRQAWGAWLKAHDFSASLTPATARDALGIVEECITLADTMSRIRADIRQEEHERDALVIPLAELCARLGMVPVGVQPAELPDTWGNSPHLLPGADWLATLDQLLAGARAACATRSHHARLTAERGALVDQYEAALRVLDATNAEIMRLLNEGDAADGEMFRHRGAAWAERRALLQRQGDLLDKLTVAAGDDSLEALRADLAASDYDGLEMQATSLRNELSRLAETETAHVDSAATLRAELGTLSTADTLAALRRQEAALLEEMRARALEWSRYALARHFLQTAKHRFEAERQPQVIREASTIFGHITGGAWDGIASSLEDNHLRVLPHHGEPISPDVLSRGTQEQLYLALRLAYIRSHAAHAEPLPVIMDDILVNFDPTRAERTAKALAGLAAGDAHTPGHQILFFTCHPHAAEMLARVVPDAGMFHVERGRVRAA